MQYRKRKSATFEESQEERKRDVAREIISHTNMSYDSREELLEEPKIGDTTKRSKCYVANLMIGGMLTTALTDIGAEVTYLSKEFVNKNIERLRRCPIPLINEVTLRGPMGGKVVLGAQLSSCCFFDENPTLL